MNTQGTLSGYKTTKEFVNELSKHLNIVKVCDSSTLSVCFSDNVYWDVINISKNKLEPNTIDISKVKTAKDLGKSDWNTEVLGFQLNNGTSGLIAYNPDCQQNIFSNQITGTSCIAVVYDTSGFTKPNTYGKDLRVVNAKLGCAFKSDSVCFGTPFLPAPMTFEECTGYQAVYTGENITISSGGEASTLGIKQCRVANDYWAGAVKTCGGINKIANHAQLDEIAQYLFPTITINSTGMTYCPSINHGNCRDEAKSNALGFKQNMPAYEFGIWSSEEQNGLGAYYRSFTSTLSGWGSFGRNHTAIQAICISD